VSQTICNNKEMQRHRT